jgi:hypothetical protein
MVLKEGLDIIVIRILTTIQREIFGGGLSRVPTHSRATPRPYMPTFLDDQPQDNRSLHKLGCKS